MRSVECRSTCIMIPVRQASLRCPACESLMGAKTAMTSVVTTDSGNSDGDASAAGIRLSVASNASEEK